MQLNKPFRLATWSLYDQIYYEGVNAPDNIELLHYSKKRATAPSQPLLSEKHLLVCHILIDLSSF